MREYTQGVCADGAAILEDGRRLTIEEVLDKLRETSRLRSELNRANHKIGTLWHRIHAFERERAEG